MSVVDLLPLDFRHREFFSERLVDSYGEAQAKRIVEALSTTSGEVGYWINPLLFDQNLAPTQIWPQDQSVDGLPHYFIAAERERVTRSEFANQGQLYVQNPSSYFAAQMLKVQPDEEVLDLAAAPGGKTLALAVAMKNRGRLAAVEPIAKRFHRLQANVKRCGVEIAHYYQRDGRGVGRAVGERFDRVLLDAPCSSESRMRWDNADTYQHWQPRKVKEAQRKQKSLLRSAYAALKPGGTLLYCTCTFNLEENERVVHHLLGRTDALIDEIDPHCPGCPTLVQSGFTQHLGKSLHPSLAGTLRILPHGQWDGFYLARLKKPV